MKHFKKKIDTTDVISLAWSDKISFEEILKNPLTDKWNNIFMDEWKLMDKHAHLKDLPTNLE